MVNANKWRRRVQVAVMIRRMIEILSNDFGGKKKDRQNEL